MLDEVAWEVVLALENDDADEEDAEDAEDADEDPEEVDRVLEEIAVDEEVALLELEEDEVGPVPTVSTQIRRCNGNAATNGDATTQ